MTLWRTCLLVVLWASFGQAHDMVQQGQAGPYELTVYINPHARTQGFVEVAVRSQPQMPEHVALSITNVDRSRGEFQDAVASDSGLFRASLPIPVQAQWRLHVRAEGSQGSGQFSVPVSAAAPFAGVAVWAERGLRVVGWGCLSLALFFGLRKTSRMRRRLLPVSAVVASPLLFLGWTGDLVQRVFYHPAVYLRLYQPVNLDTKVEGNRLELHMEDPGWVRFRRFDDLIPDHGHLMHLYALRVPELDRVYHLHPEMTGPATLEKQLPDMAAGRYMLVADIVHDTGLWEAPQGELVLPAAIQGGAFRGDDSGGAGHRISEARFDSSSFEFDDGSRLVWDRPSHGLRAAEPTRLVFHMEDRDGNLLPDAELYMGMLGHAAIVRHDREVFTHVHPTGSIPMASLEALNESEEAMMCHTDSAETYPAKVAFPHAFPEPGRYRLIVQMKRNGEVRTAFFDAAVGRAVEPGHVSGLASQALGE